MVVAIDIDGGGEVTPEGMDSVDPNGDGCDIVNLCSLSVIPMEVDVPEMTAVADLVEVVVVKPDSSVVCTDGGGLVSHREPVVRNTCIPEWHSSSVQFYLS